MRSSTTERISVDLDKEIKKLQEHYNKNGIDLSKTQASKILAEEYKRLKCGKLLVNLRF